MTDRRDIVILGSTGSIGTQAIDGSTITLDARVPGVLAALIALILRAPFLVVIISAAAVTAAVRAMGWLP